MKLITKLKYPKVYKKIVNVNELSEEEKYAYFRRIIEENLDVNFITQIIETYPSDQQSFVADRIILIIYGIDDKYVKYCEELVDKYLDEDILKNNC